MGFFSRSNFGGSAQPSTSSDGLPAEPGSEAPLQSTKRPLRAFLTPPEPYHTAGCADRRRWSPVRTGDAPAARAPPARRPVRCRARGSGTRSTRSSRSHRSCRRGSRSRCAGLPTRAASGRLRTVRAGRPPKPAAGRGPRRGRRRRHGGRGRGRGLRGRGWRPMRSWYPGAGSTTRCRLPEAGGSRRTRRWSGGSPRRGSGG